MAGYLLVASTALSLAVCLHAAVADQAGNVCRFNVSNPTSCRLPPPAVNVVYLGDSTMFKLYEHSNHVDKPPCTKTPYRVCHLAAYLGLTQVNESEWVKPSG